MASEDKDQGTAQGKFQNLHLTRGCRAGDRYGMFDAIVRLARPEYRPSYMKILGPFSPGFMRAQLDYTAFPQATADSNVLGVELHAYHASSQPSVLQ